MNINALKKLVEYANDSPENAIKFLFYCLYLYQQGEDEALGYLGYVMSKKLLHEDSTSPSGLKLGPSDMGLVSRLKEPRNKNVIIASMGASWKRDYKNINVDSFSLHVEKKDKMGDDLRLFIKSGGRDLSYPIKLRKNNKKKWKITGGFSSILTGVREPKSEAEDF
ncbi:MAG: DUF6935 domain-containing protein [Promethearchaeota archaeon]